MDNQTKNSSNLHQISKAIMSYKKRHDNKVFIYWKERLHATKSIFIFVMHTIFILDEILKRKQIFFK